MPKKRASLLSTKPTTPVHPSLSSSNGQNALKAPRSLHTAANLAGNSVNDLIQRHRLSRSSEAPKLSESLDHRICTHTVHPSLKAILQIPDTPTPRPRSRLQIRDGVRVWGSAGPPPPNSWLRRGAVVPDSSRRKKAIPFLPLEPLPDLCLPKRRSLVFQALRALAQNWEWHLQYDHCYLATLPVRYKEALLYLIARDPSQTLSIIGLDILFLDATVFEDANGSEGLTHLDLSASIGQGISLKDLHRFFEQKSLKLSDHASDDRVKIIPDTWDTPSISTLPAHPMPPFFSLTHLSLSRPTNASWKALLGITPHFATLTHLSLAYWPSPSLTPNSKIAYRENQRGRVDYGATNYYSHSIDGDWSEAAAILRRLSRATYCLKWLDLTGCWEWIWALQSDNGPDWNGAWRRLQTVRVGEGWNVDHGVEPNIERPAESSTHGLGEHSENPHPWNPTGKLGSYDTIVREIEELINQMKHNRACASKPSAELADQELSEPRLSSLNPWWDEHAGLASPTAGPITNGQCNRVVLERD